MSGSAKAACRSSARSRGLEPSLRVVGNSTARTSQRSSRRRSPSSKGPGKTAGSALLGERTATRSPRRGFSGYRIR